MGCDIHCVIERKIPGERQWLGVIAGDHVRPRPTYARRDYDLFAELAQVRGRSETGAYSRGLPADISRLAWEQFSQCSIDYHTPSHMSLSEFAECFVRVADRDELRDTKIRKEYAVYDLFGIVPEEGEEWRVVFWFDN